MIHPFELPFLCPKGCQGVQLEKNQKPYMENYGEQTRYQCLRADFSAF